jgi:hypothetical protein
MESVRRFLSDINREPSLTLSSLSRSQIAAYEAKKAVALAEGKEFTEVLTLLPSHLTHKFSKQVCSHGCKQKPRGQNVRTRGRTSYTGSPAKLTAESVQDPATGKWIVQIKNEVSHKLDDHDACAGKT